MENFIVSHSQRSIVRHRRMWLAVLSAIVVLIIAAIRSQYASAQGGMVSPSQPRQWQPVSVSFNGPSANETDTAPNPFLDYRLQVTFTGPGGQVYNVPGFFDGNGSGGGSGNVWRVRFTPDQAGSWSYRASFRSGTNIAVDLSTAAGTPTSFDGASGTFAVAARDAAAPGFLKWGRLEYIGAFYFKFKDGPYFLKNGADSPESFFGFDEFDNTPFASHHFDSHANDWQPGDPTWDSSKGKPIIGALNYLSSVGINGIYFITMNIGGDAKDTYPYVSVADRNGSSANDNLHFDISKLRQWDIVMDHAQRKGIFLHVVLGEGESNNKLELDGATLGVERKLYYREMVARFGYHNALQWNVSEEYDIDRNIGEAEAKRWGQYLKDIDPYGHPRAVHNTGSTGEPYKQFLKQDSPFTSASLQFRPPYDRGAHYETWRANAVAENRPIPISIDEFEDITTDVEMWRRTRKEFIWPAYLSGGAGLELYMGGRGGADQNLQNFRQYAELYRWASYARRFVEEQLPFWEMQPSDALLTGETNEQGQVFAKPGHTYTIYYPNASATGTLNLSNTPGTFDLRWYNPRTGAFEGTTTSVSGGRQVNLGSPPSTASDDWVALLKLTSGGTPSSSSVYLPLVRRDPLPSSSPSPLPSPLPSPPASPPTSPPPSGNRFVEKNGVVSMESERYTTHNNKWEVDTRSGASGQVMRPKDGAGDRAAALDFQIEFKTTGTWYLWVRSFAPDSENNGIVFDIDGVRQRNGPYGNRDHIYFKKGKWFWTPEWQGAESGVHQGPVTFTITQAGTHKLTIRNRGNEQPYIDKIVLTTDARPSFLTNEQTDLGPPETNAGIP